VKLCLKGLQGALQVTRRWTSSAEEHLVVQWFTKMRTDGRNPSRRFREVSRAVRSYGGAREILQVFPRGGRLRRGRPLILATRAVGSTRISCIEVS
jgi:hypothetical protein